eukprot:1114112-Lingulodinium_polyedra.AAC.1
MPGALRPSTPKSLALRPKTLRGFKDPLGPKIRDPKSLDPAPSTPDIFDPKTLEPRPKGPRP